MSGGGMGGGYGGSQSGYGMRPMSSRFGMSNGYTQNAPSGFAGFGQQASSNDAIMRANYMGQPQMANSSPVPEPPTPPTNGGFPIPYQMPIFPGQSTTSAGGWNLANRGFQVPFMPIFPGPTNTSTGWWNRANAGKQMSTPNVQTQPEMSGFNPMVGSQMQPMPTQGPQMSGGNMETQTPQTQPVQPRQSFEQFAQTLNGSGMSSGQMNDLYQKSLQPQSTNFWANTGVGTQKPAGFQTPDNWGKQTYGFDPKSLAGKQVGPDMAWYYGRDAIGRTINNQGDAVASFSNPADGFQRRRPWMG